jgi:threonine dehydrogenase-like Zn-dependent dehydrogenase
VLGLGPIGDMACRIALHRGASKVIGIDLVPDRLQRAAARGVETLDLSKHGRDELIEAARALTDGRGPDAVIDAVGMEAHGAPFGKFAQTMAGFLPDTLAEKLIDVAAVDRLSALYLAIDLVRRGGTISLSGVYGGQMDPIPMMELFDKQIQVRMGQANVKRWVDEILPLLEGDDDPLGVDEFATHRIPIDRAPEAYETFQKKSDGMVKTLIQP